MTTTKKKARAAAGTNTTSDPTVSTDPRERLRQTITAVQFEQNRVIALLEARDRCRQQQSLARSRLSDAQAALKSFQAEGAARLAYTFMNENTVEADDTAIQQECEAAKTALTKLEKVEWALDEEIGSTQIDIRAKARQRDAALSDYVVGSDQYRSLLQAHTAAWRALRTIKTSLQAVSAGCRQLPQKYVEEPVRSEPVEERVGYPIDRELVNSWSDALAALAMDADAELPPSDGAMNFASLPPR